MFLSGKTEPAPPRTTTTKQSISRSPSLRDASLAPPSLSHSNLSFSAFLFSLRRSHRAAIQHIKTRWLKMHHTPPPPLLFTAHDLLRGGTACSPCVLACVFVHVQPFFIPCLLRHKHPLIKSVIFSPIWWHPGSWERGGGSRGQRSLKGASHFWETCERMACAWVCACNQKQRAVC